MILCLLLHRYLRFDHLFANAFRLRVLGGLSSDHRWSVARRAFIATGEAAKWWKIQLQTAMDTVWSFLFITCKHTILVCHTLLVPSIQR